MDGSPSWLRPGWIEPSALRALDLAQEVAQGREEPRLTTAHLLVALAEEEGSPFRAALIAHAVSPASLRDALDDLDPALMDGLDLEHPLFRGPLPHPSPGIWPAPDLAAVVLRAEDAAVTQGRRGPARHDLAAAALSGGASDTGLRLLQLVGVAAPELLRGLEPEEDAAETEGA